MKQSIYMETAVVFHSSAVDRNVVAELQTVPLPCSPVKIQGSACIFP